MKTFSYFKEDVHDDAIKCRHCHSIGYFFKIPLLYMMQMIVIAPVKLNMSLGALSHPVALTSVSTISSPNPEPPLLPENLLATSTDRLAAIAITWFTGFDFAQGLGQLQGHPQTLFGFFPHHPEHHPEGAHRPGVVQIHPGRDLHKFFQELENPGRKTS